MRNAAIEVWMSHCMRAIFVEIADRSLRPTNTAQIQETTVNTIRNQESMPLAMLLGVIVLHGGICFAQMNATLTTEQTPTAISVGARSNEWVSLGGPWEACTPNDMAVGYEGGTSYVYTIGGPNRRLLVSTNEGDSWTALSMEGTAAVACLGNQPRTVYTSRQDASQYVMSRSNDGGATWTDCRVFNDPVSRIAVCPDDPAILFAGLGGRQHDVNRPLWRSTDSGRSWNEVTSLNAYAQITQIVVDRDAPSIIYLSTCGTMGGVWKSTDDGTTWSLKNSGITNVQVASLAMATGSATSVLYAGTRESGTADPLIYSSTDGGEHWTVRVSNSGATDIAVDPSQPNLVYAATNAGVLFTENAGASWLQRSSGITGKDCRRIGMVQQQDHQVHLLLGTRAAFYRSEDHGAHWMERTTGMTRVSCYGVTASAAGIFAVAYGGREQGSFVHRGGDGDKWEVLLDNSVFTPGEHSEYFGFAIAGSHIRPNIILASGTNGNDYPQVIFRTTDAGDSWERVYSNNASNQVCNIVFDPDDDRFVYTADAGHILKSTDGGSTWEQLAGSPPLVYSIGVSTHSQFSSKLLFAGGSRKIFKSEDEGKTWSPSGDGIPSPVVSLACDPINPLIVFAGTNHHRVYWTTDGGSDWQPRCEGIYGDFIQSLIIHPSGGVIYACAEDYYGAPTRIYRSTNLGATWRDITTGLADAIVYDLKVDATTPNAIVAATNRGIFRYLDTPIIVTGHRDDSEGHASTCRLEQNYPDPFNPVTNIRFTIERTQVATLRVYDVAGREVETLLHELKTPGVYTVQWSAAGVASGTYFYSLETTSGSLTRRMLLLR